MSKVNFSEMASQQSIPEFYAGKNVFVTGGTGLVGKVLVEKLLRSCPDIENIYLLIRPRKNVASEKRIEEYRKHMLFDLLRSQRPEALEKIKLVRGDVSQLDLGLSLEDRQLLQECVNIVFHAAASVRFDDSLFKAILINTRGTREVVNLALGMKNLEVFMHVSTAYSNSDRFDIEEKMYPTSDKWQTYIEAVETLEPFTVNTVTRKLLGKMPNTYIFSKCLAEQIINDYSNQLPMVMIRPSVVVGIHKEPLPGYVENFNGPVGLLVGAGKGILRTSWVDGDSHLDCIPADEVIKGMIIGVWKKGVSTSRNQMPIYNASNFGTIDCTLNKIKDEGFAALSLNPMSCAYYPLMFFTTNEWVYLLIFYVAQLTTAVFMDLLLWLRGKKLMAVKIQQRLFNAMSTVHHFSCHEWNFYNGAFKKLDEELLDCDLRNFHYQLEGTQCFNHISAAIKILRLNLVPETVTQKQATLIYTSWYYIHCFLCSTAVWLGLWACYTYSVPQKCVSMLIHLLQTVLLL